MKETLVKLLTLFNKREKQKLIFLFLMMIIAGLFETIGIGLIVPMVGIITSPELIDSNNALSFFYNLFNFNSKEAFIIFSVIFLLLIFVIKNLFLLFFNHTQYKIILNQQVKLSSTLFEKYLTKPYVFHLERNTSSLLRNINEEVPKVFQGIIMSIFQLLTESLVILFIFVLLIINAPLATISASLLLGGSVFLFLQYIKNKVTKLGKEQQKVSGSVIKWVNQGLGASKEVKVQGKEKFFINKYSNQVQIKAVNSRVMKMYELIPRLFIETLLVAIVLITMLIIIYNGSSTTQVISTMALFAMSAFRLMPSINRVMAMITTVRYSLPALTVIYDDLYDFKPCLNEQQNVNIIDSYPEINGSRIFKESITMNEVSFSYPKQSDYAIKGLSLTIPIGKSVAFIGESGAGKSTIVDIILGLYQPQQGSVQVDGINLSDLQTLWQKKIGYIPQSIFLSDDTIRGNVAFGIDEKQIDDNAVWRALNQAQMTGFVNSLPNKLETKVGERGVRLSGGQRQRIGIARALYHNPEILFMDEATSALDNETEKEIMRAIDGLKGQKTLIIIAHRLSTIENCDIVYKINNGRLVEVENKSWELVNRSKNLANN
ncbi:ABC transporter ATP-binding protein [Litchfieldia alkalitelluris]|uniref:ABC transporter ATP-binding protein n=1 Tax=Litchfieldia alkalitelluris TaxID=304268 RepID=UPI0009964EA7|nr:ABC transporter ATP-binding protein [Litchfieldia alkalitelluris]